MNPRIYVASLSDYNAGILHGAWIDANQDADSIHEEIQAMLSQSPTATTEGQPAEEWAIHDFEEFRGLSLDSYESIERVSRLGSAISEHGEAYAAYVNLVGPHYATPEGFEEGFQGEWDSEQDFAYQLADDIGLFTIHDSLGRKVDIDTLESYFDWDKWTRDLFMSDYRLSPSSTYTVYVFRMV